VSRRGRSDFEILTEVVAGIAGGIVGSKIPDWAEPAINSWHRGPVHSVTAATLGGTAAVPQLQALDGWLDRRILDLRRAQAMARTPQEANAYMIEIVFWLAVAAFMKGLLAGYLSHLALDATTPRGIPFF
jgi:membrane-bound metal-dependent hydrolase YbcI (DUF457 family)